MSNFLLHFMSSILLVCMSTFFCAIIVLFAYLVSNSIAIKTVGRYSKHKALVHYLSLLCILMLLGSATYLVW